MERPGHTLSEIAQAVGGECIGNGAVRVKHLVIDTRKPFEPSTSLFIALKGERHDGHRYVRELAERGMGAFLVSDASVLAPGANDVVVPDTLVALQRLAAWHRAQFTLPVVGITGSNGKTVVKEWLYQMLRGEERIVRSPGSWNSQVGVPLSVWEIAAEHTLGLFEAGISKPGEMARLQPIIKPDIGVFTNLGPAHSEGFASDEVKAQEKLALFSEASVLVYCADHEVVRRAIEAAPHKVTVRDWSRSRDAYVRVLSENISGTSAVIDILHNGGEHAFTLPFTDDASRENALHCITLLLHLGRSTAWIDAHLAHLAPVEMRLRTMEGVHDSTLIDDTYSNDLASLRIALDHQARIAQGRERVVVLSDIAESSEEDDMLYTHVAQLLKSAGVQRVIGVGPALSKRASLFPSGSRFHASTEELLRTEDPATFTGAAVLIKGARRFGLERAVERWQHQVHGTVLEVDLDAVRHNLNHYRALIAPTTGVMAMVKAFGYGSGALELARLFAHERVHYLGVAYADEGIELRQYGITTPVLVMNPEPVPMETLHRFGLEAEVYDLRSLHEAMAFAEHAGTAPAIHIKLDTGMHRLGFMEHELPALLEALRNAKKVRVAGILSHLAASEDPAHDAFTRAQIARFATAADRIDAVLGYHPLRHMANSGGIARFPEAHFDLVRLGIGMHGIGANAAETAQLRPTATLRTVIAQVKDIPAHDSIGYGRSFEAAREMRIAVLPIGYADGLSRRLGNGKGRVWIHGTPAPFTGTICMDMCMVDVTDIPCTAGDDAIVFDAAHPLQDYAQALGTIPYEALTSISPRVKRVYLHA